MKPNLVEPGVKYIINKTFINSNIIKEKYNNTIFNVLMLFFIFSLIFIILFYKYKGKLSENEIKIRNIKNKKYLLEKINEINYIRVKKNKEKNMITNLPLFEKDPVISLYTKI